MIRIIYWLFAIIEILLLLGMLLLFIITDSRTVKLIADNTLDTLHLQYDSIEGNFITGLEISNLRYENKALFQSAKLHWNPLTLFYNRVTLTEFNAKGVELKNILEMINSFESSNNNSNSKLELAFSVKQIHLDINPYVYEGVKFSDFHLETEQIDVDRSLNIDNEAMYLYFESDLANIELEGKIEKSRVLIENINLTKISSRDLRKFIRKLREKNKNSTDVTAKRSEISHKKSIIKAIKINRIYGTIKPVKYEPLSIKKATLIINNAEVDPNSFDYKAKKVTFKGTTNFGDVALKGYIKKSMIHAKGDVLLSKELFSRYKLPLKYENLHKLPATLRLTDEEVWLDVDHKVQELLKLRSTFNVDVSKAQHHFHYDYSDRELTVKSLLNAKMPYGENISISNDTLVDEKGNTTYHGSIEIPKLSNLPIEVSDYLLEGIGATYEGDIHHFVATLNSKLLNGTFETVGFENANMKLNSKQRNIALNKLVPAINQEFENELLSVESESYFDFNNGKNSKTDLTIHSNIAEVSASMKLYAPYKVLFSADIPHNSSLLKIDKNINLNALHTVEGEVLIEDRHYLVNLNSKNGLKFNFHYDVEQKLLSEGKLVIGKNVIYFDSSSGAKRYFKSDIAELELFFHDIEKFYNIELPKLHGAVSLKIREKDNGDSHIEIESQNIKYLSKKSPINFNDIALAFSMDKNLNIFLDHYTFKLDENDYMYEFSGTKPSLLRIEDKKIIFKEVWLNDQAILKGYYDVDSSKGEVTLISDKFVYNKDSFDLLLNLNLNIKIKDEFVDVEGLIDVLGNSITYEIAGSSIVEDSDIIIKQEEDKKSESALNNVKLYLKIKSSKPLRYMAKDIDIELFTEATVLKDYDADFMVMGMSTITKGEYRMEDKVFRLNESHVYFSGDIKKPLLDIKANYEKDQYLVHIFISGSTEEPIVNFNSDPYLTQQEILSLILFDGTGSSNGHGAEAYTLLGGTFAKGLIKSLGIDVDHLLLGTDANDALSLEVGRKITDDITIMYMHRDGKDGAKVRIEHSRNFETDIIIQPPNTSSIEFLYKQDR